MIGVISADNHYVVPSCCTSTSIAQQTRERDWANVVTCHAGDPAAYTWRLANFTLGEHVLMPPLDEQQTQGQQQQATAAAAATAVAVSCCGNFALVGNDAGRVDRYNLQSGIHRGTYWRKQPDGELCSQLFPASLHFALLAIFCSYHRRRWVQYAKQPCSTPLWHALPCCKPYVSGCWQAYKPYKCTAYKQYCMPYQPLYATRIRIKNLKLAFLGAAVMFLLSSMLLC
jgi:hypothetical protein